MKGRIIVRVYNKDIKLRKEQFIVPTIFFVLSIIGIMGAGVSLGFIKNELYNRFIASGIMVLALLIPIYAGMGLNFSISIGAISAQAASILVIGAKVSGILGLISIFILTTIICLILGNIIGFILNRAKGKEMITSIIIGLLGTSLYQLVFMVGYGSVVHPRNKEIILSNGIGVRNMVDLMEFKILMNRFSVMPILIIVLCAAFVKYITGTKFGCKLKAVGQGVEVANMLGIDGDKVRRYAIVISTVMAGIGHLLFMLNMGNINVYTGHLNIDIFACAALLAGGATLTKASISNAFIGIILFHTLFIVSPLAGQNLFQNVALGEYFRSFIAYGVIAIAFVINLRNERKIHKTE